MKTILVVDDFASVRFFHQSLLKKAGFATISAPDGGEALAALEKQPVDLVVLDLLMPKMSGTEFIQRVRAIGRFASLPVLVITSEAGQEQAKKLAGLPGLKVLAKPILPETFVGEVRRLLPA
jgi:CheY-like chemotaxis protein